MKSKIKLTETATPMGGASLYNPKYRDLSIELIEDLEQETLQSYAAVGYNSFTFHRLCAQINIRKIEVKTMDDVFMTDTYGLLK